MEFSGGETGHCGGQRVFDGLGNLGLGEEFPCLTVQRGLGFVIRHEVR